MQLTEDGGAIAYDYIASPDGQAPVLFLHGALGVRGQFDALRTLFPERGQLAPDFAAHGQSRAGDGAASSERLARDMLSLLDALDIARVDVIGHSMGGYVGLVMAHLAPQRVNRIVTLGTKFYWSAQAIGKTRAELDAGLLRTRSQRFYDALAAMHTAEGADGALAFAQALIGDFARWQLDEDMLRAAGVPVLVCAGDRDNMVPAAEVMRLVDALDPKMACAAILPGTPHPLQQAPLACLAQAVRRFWDFAPGQERSAA